MAAEDHLIQSALLDENDQQTTDPSENTEQQQQHQLPPDYTSSVNQELEPSDEEEDDHDDSTQPDENNLYDENGQIKFPLTDLIKLEEQLNQTRWVVPVLPDGELIKCLTATVHLAGQSKSFSHQQRIFPSNGFLFLELDSKSDACQRFIRDSLVNSFTKVLCDEAVQTWKQEIFVRRSTKRFSYYLGLLVFLEIYLSKLYGFSSIMCLETRR